MVFGSKSGIVSVLDVIYGDVDDSGEPPDMADAIILRRYTAGWEIPVIMPGLTHINLAAADVNVDGKVDTGDAIILRRHVAGWPEYAILPWKEPLSPITAFGAQLFIGTPTIKVADIKGKAGDTVKVPIIMENNPGIISMGLNVIFDDEALRLVGEPRNMDTGLLLSALHPPYSGGKSPIRFSWEDGLATKNNTNNGEIVILEFEILASSCTVKKSDARRAVSRSETTEGEYEIALEIVPNSIRNTLVQNVRFDAKDGAVTTEPHTCDGYCEREGCGYLDNKPVNNVPITSLKIDASPVTTVARNGIYSFDLLLNEGATGDNVVWTVSDPSFAIIDEEANIYILNKTGTVRLIATDPVSGLMHSITLRIAS